MSDSINIRPLKAIATKLEDPLRTLILSEPDILPKEEYLIKIQEWLKIVDLSEKEGED